MEPNKEKEIIELYLSGLGSTNIGKMLNINQHIVRTILKKYNVLRNRYHSEEDYKDYWFEDNHWHSYWICEICQKPIKCTATKKYLLHRNLKKKKVCRECSFKAQIGEGNPFYGKKHTQKSKDKISKTKSGVSTSDHMQRPEYRELFREIGKKRFGNNPEWNNKMKEGRIKYIEGGGKISCIRSKAEKELIKTLRRLKIKCISSYRVESKIFDIFIPKFNLLIEYNGTYWHSDPRKYNADYFNHKKQKTAKEIWDYDQKKLDLAKNNGYIVEVIWEIDYKTNNDCLLKLIQKYNDRTNNKSNK